MICKQCGQKATDGDVFCKHCGNRLDTVTSETGPDESVESTPGAGFAGIIGRRKKALFAALIVIGLVAILFKVLPFGGGVSSDYKLVKGENKPFHGADVAHVLDPDNTAHMIPGEIEPGSYYYSTYHTGHSMDRRTTSFIADNDDEQTLWLVSSQGLTRVCDDVLTQRMSDDGKAIAYITDVDPSGYGYEGTLWIYNCQTKKTNRIGDHVFPGEYAISPDGKTVAYMVNFEGYDGDFETYIWDNGKTVKLGDNTVVFAVADNRKYLYYAKLSHPDDLNFCVRHKDKEVILLSPRDFEDGGDVAFMYNADYSQFVFSIGDKTYLSMDGKERQLLCAGHASMVVTPQHTQFINHYGDEVGYTIYGVNSFRNSIIAGPWDGFGLWHVDGEYRARGICSDAAHIHMAGNGNTLVYEDSASGDLYRIDISKRPGVNLRKVTRPCSESIDRLFVSNNGKAIYCLNGEGDLWCVDGDVPRRIARDVESDGVAFDTENDELIYIARHAEGGSDRGALCYYRSGMDGPRGAGNVGNVDVVTPYPDSVVLQVVNENDNVDIFCGNRKKGFKMVLRDLPWGANPNPIYARGPVW